MAHRLEQCPALLQGETMIISMIILSAVTTVSAHLHDYSVRWRRLQASLTRQCILRDQAIDLLSL